MSNGLPGFNNHPERETEVQLEGRQERRVAERRCIGAIKRLTVSSRRQRAVEASGVRVTADRSDWGDAWILRYN